MLKKLLREIDRLEQSKTKKVEQIKMLQDEVNKIDEELKPYYALKKQYEKLESTANQLFENNWCYLERIKAMANLKDVQDIMKYIEEITSKLQYSSFEVALLIAERSELTHQEITPELVEKVQELSDSYDSLFNEGLNEELDELFIENEKQATKISSLEELQEHYNVENTKAMKKIFTFLSEGVESEPEFDKEDSEPDIGDGY